MTTHINTILDYSLYWILSIKVHHEAYGDLAFVEQVYPKMVTLIEFCEEQLDEHGFIIGRSGDWIFIDWADLQTGWQKYWHVSSHVLFLKQRNRYRHPSRHSSKTH